MSEGSCDRAAETEAALARGGAPTEDAAAHAAGCVECARLFERHRIATSREDRDGAATVATVAEPAAEAHARATMAEPFRPGVQIGRYSVLERVGEGGMGAVYAVYDRELDRRVAMKVLHAGVAGVSRTSAGEARLVREARALARLSNESVVSVFDVGEYEGRVYLVMEFVAGVTLRQWQKDARRWQDILAHYLSAGRGLIAAHAAGLVHRDFKPDNVLLGADGRVRVMDFGLARGVGDAVRSPSDGSDGGQESDATGSLSGPLTQVGVVVGTPAYMAPEQFEGEPAGEKADQFSFAVSLYEALHRARPFPKGKHADPGRWVLQPPSKESVCPRWLRPILQRALALNPGDRFPSLAAMLEEIHRARRRVLLTRAAGAALGVASIAAAVLVLPTLQARTACREDAAAIAAEWPLARRTAISSAFEKTALSYASPSFESASAAVDAYVSSWEAAAYRGCEAARVRRTMPAEVYALTRECLADRRSELKALLSLFEAADATIVGHAPVAAASLSRIDDCADVSRLIAQNRGTMSPEALARLAAFREQIAELKVAFSAGAGKKFIAQAEKLIADLEASGLPAAEQLSDLYRYLGMGRMLTGAAHQEVKRLNFEAYVRADEAGDDDRKAAAAVRMVHLANMIPDEAYGEEAVRLASAAARRSGSASAQADALASEGSLRFTLKGESEKAIPLYERALELLRSTANPSDVRLIQVQMNLANALGKAGRDEEALVLHQQLLDQRLRLSGPHHPNAAVSDFNIASVLRNLGRYRDARARMTAATHVVIASYGPSSSVAAVGHLGVAHLTWEMGDLRAAAEAIEKTLAIRTALGGAENAYAAEASAILGVLRGRLGDEAAAKRLGEQSRAVHRKLLAGGKPEARFAVPLAHAAEAAGDFAEACRLAELALESERLKNGARSATVTRAQLHVGRTCLSGGRVARAREVLTAVVDHIDANLGRDNALAGEARLYLGRVAAAERAWGEALRLAAAAEQIFVRALGADSPLVPQATVLVGQALLELSRPAEAVAALEKVVAAGDQVQEPGVLASATAQLRRARLVLAATAER